MAKFTIYDHDYDTMATEYMFDSVDETLEYLNDNLESFEDDQELTICELKPILDCRIVKEVETQPAEEF